MWCWCDRECMELVGRQCSACCVHIPAHQHLIGETRIRFYRRLLKFNVLLIMEVHRQKMWNSQTLGEGSCLLKVPSNVLRPRIRGLKYKNLFKIKMKITLTVRRGICSLAADKTWSWSPVLRYIYHIKDWSPVLKYYIYIRLITCLWDTFVSRWLYEEEFTSEGSNSVSRISNSM